MFSRKLVVLERRHFMDREANDKLRQAAYPDRRKNFLSQVKV
jgi:hypothetical protein